SAEGAGEGVPWRGPRHVLGGAARPRRGDAGPRHPAPERHGAGGGAVEDARRQTGRHAVPRGPELAVAAGVDGAEALSPRFRVAAGRRLRAVCRGGALGGALAVAGSVDGTAPGGDRWCVFLAAAAKTRCVLGHRSQGTSGAGGASEKPSPRVGKARGDGRRPFPVVGRTVRAGETTPERRRLRSSPGAVRGGIAAQTPAGGPLF